MSAPDVRRLLEDLGSIEPPPPDPDFIDRLEFQLRAETIAFAPETTYDEAPWRVPFGIAAAAFTVVAGVAGITVIRDMPERQVSAQLAAATNARVVLPNGEQYEAVPGMVIPKGAVVEVFSGGLAEINGVKLAAGQRVVVTGDGAVKAIDADDMPLSDDVQMAAPGEGSGGDRSPGTRLDPSFPSRASEPATGDGVAAGLSTVEDSGPLRHTERTAKSRGLDALRRPSDDAPPQTSVTGTAPSVDDEVPSTDQAAPPSTTVPETTSPPAPEAGPAPAPPETAAPTPEPPAADSPTTEPPATAMPAPQAPTTVPTPAPTVPPTTTPPTTAPEPTPPPTSTPDPSVPAVPPSGTTTTTTPDVDPSGGEDGGEVTLPGTPGKGDDGPGGGGDPTGYDPGAAGTEPKPSDDPATGDEQAAADDADDGADEQAVADDTTGDGAESGDTTEDSGSGTDETAAAQPTPAA